MPTCYDSRFVEGIDCFNAGAFFEAHEVWEDLWTECQGQSRRFYQGLIQMAVCLHHFGNGNTRGARKLYDSCRKYLEAYRPYHEGIDLDRLLTDLQRCCAAILESEESFPSAPLEASLLPHITLDDRVGPSGA